MRRLPPPRRRLPTLLSMSETALLKQVRPSGERRVFERFDVGFPLSIVSAEHAQLGVCVSYSRRGMLVLAQERLHLGKRAALEIPLGSVGAASVRLEALVLRVKCDTSNRLFRFPTALLVKSHVPALVHEALLRAHRRAA